MSHFKFILIVSGVDIDTDIDINLNSSYTKCNTRGSIGISMQGCNLHNVVKRRASSITHSLFNSNQPSYPTAWSSFLTASSVWIFFICVSSSFSPPARRILSSSIARIFFSRPRTFLS